MSPSVAIKSYDKIGLNSGVVLDLPGFEGAGSILYDLSRDHNNGIIYGATWTQLASGLWVLGYDGDDYVDIGETFQATFRDSCTLSIWVKPTDGQPAASQFIMGSKNASAEDQLNLRIDTTGDLIAYYKSNNNGVQASGGAGTFTNGQQDWHRIDVVTDSANTDTEGIKLYLDATKIATGDAAAVTFAIWTSVDEFFIGAYDLDGTATSYFTGLIALPRIRNEIVLGVDLQCEFNRERSLFGV